MRDTELARLMLKLEILSQNACEDFSSNKKFLLSQKDKVLFVISEYAQVSPTVLINRLHIVKSNLALICKQLLTEGYITSTADKSDRRVIYYTVTDQGKKYLDSKLSYIQNNTIACTQDPEFLDSLKKVIETLSERF